jgi:hypothetical protein
MKINVCLLQPSGYIHSMALLEAAEYVHYKCVALGHQSELAINKYGNDNLNIIFGAHISPANTPRLPKNTVIFNTEQLPENSTWNNQVYKDLLLNHYVWDYSQTNLALIDHANKSLIEFYFEKKLLRITPAQNKKFDLLFYGSLNERRIEILKKLEQNGFSVGITTNLYGRERDELLSQSLAVLNLHYYDSQIFQQIRCFYPLINQIPIISEDYPYTSAPKIYSESIFTPKSKNLVDYISRLLEDRNSFSEQAKNKIDNFKYFASDDMFKFAFEKTCAALELH